jgi:hypothetical protein
MILIRILNSDVANVRKMSVHGVADKTVEILETGKYPVVILNLANPDMVSLDANYIVKIRLDIQASTMLLLRRLGIAIKQSVQFMKLARSLAISCLSQQIMGSLQRLCGLILAMPKR